MKRNREILKGLIAVEGIDAAGTTTLTGNLSEALRQSGSSVIRGCEPTDGPIGKIIRQGLSGSVPMAPESLALLFAADRREHLFGPEGISSLVSDDSFYVTDRYFFSSLAYQSLECSWDWVNELNSAYPLPEYLIYLGIPVTEAMKRISGREKKDIYETGPIQEKVSALYDRSIDFYRDCGMKVLRLDSRRSPEEIGAEAAKFVMQN